MAPLSRAKIDNVTLTMRHEDPKEGEEEEDGQGINDAHDGIEKTAEPTQRPRTLPRAKAAEAALSSTGRAQAHIVRRNRQQRPSASFDEPSVTEADASLEVRHMPLIAL